MSLDSYNSQYPSAYYEIGTVYSFYMSIKEDSQTHLATAEQIEKFAKNLSKCESENSKLMSKNGTWMKFTRTIGVVVEKTESDLTVMFRTNKGEYIIKKYAISNNAVFFDDKELAKPSATIGSANLHVVRDVTTGVDIIVGDGVDVIPNLDESTGVDIVTSTGVEPVGKRSK